MAIKPCVVVDGHHQVYVHCSLEEYRLLFNYLVGLTDERHDMLPLLVEVFQPQFLYLEVGLLLIGGVDVAL